MYKYIQCTKIKSPQTTVEKSNHRNGHLIIIKMQLRQVMNMISGKSKYTSFTDK